MESVVNYHAQYHWGEYASLTVGMVLVSVVLLFDEDTCMPHLGPAVQPVIVCLMTVAAILLCWADLVHTNTQTPIIPVKTRFKLIDQSVRLGTAGTMMIIFSVMAFVALISFIATLICATVFVGALVYSFRNRRIEKEEFFDYFKVYTGDGWNEEDHRYIGGCRPPKTESSGTILFLQLLPSGDGLLAGLAPGCVEFHCEQLHSGLVQPALDIQTVPGHRSARNHHKLDKQCNRYDSSIHQLALSLICQLPSFWATLHTFTRVFLIAGVRARLKTTR